MASVSRGLLHTSSLVMSSFTATSKVSPARVVTCLIAFIVVALMRGRVVAGSFSEVGSGCRRSPLGSSSRCLEVGGASSSWFVWTSGCRFVCSRSSGGSPDDDDVDVDVSLLVGRSLCSGSVSAFVDSVDAPPM